VFIGIIEIGTFTYPLFDLLMVENLALSKAMLLRMLEFRSKTINEAAIQIISTYTLNKDLNFL